MCKKQWQAYHGKRSRGMTLAEDKIASINRLGESADFSFEIVDLFNKKSARQEQRRSFNL